MLTPTASCHIARQPSPSPRAVSAIANANARTRARAATLTRSLQVKAGSGGRSTSGGQRRFARDGLRPLPHVAPAHPPPPPPPRANAGARRRPSPRRCVRSPSCLTPRPRLRPAPRLRCRGETCRGEAGEGGTSGASALPGSLVLESFTEPFLICHNTVSLLKPFLICHNTVSLLKPFLICHNTVSLLRGRAPVCVDAASHAVGARAARRGRRAGAGGG